MRDLAWGIERATRRSSAASSCPRCHVSRPSSQTGAIAASPASRPAGRSSSRSRLRPRGSGDSPRSSHSCGSSTRSRASGAGAGSRAATRRPQEAPAPGLRSRQWPTCSRAWSGVDLIRGTQRPEDGLPAIDHDPSLPGHEQLGAGVAQRGIHDCADDSGPRTAQGHAALVRGVRQFDDDGAGVAFADHPAGGVAEAYPTRRHRGQRPCRAQEGLLGSRITGQRRDTVCGLAVEVPLDDCDRFREELRSMVTSWCLPT